MSSTRRMAILGVFAFALILLNLVGLVMIPLAEQSEAAPAVAPTPITQPAGGSGYQNVVFWSSDALAASAGSNAIQLPGYEVLDLQYVIDQPTSVNTTTIKIQFSNDNSNWSDGINVVANNAADADAMAQFNNFGRYVRLYATVTNTNPVTITARAVAK